MSFKESALREPLVEGNKSYKDVTHDITNSIFGNPTKEWYMVFGLSVALLLYGAFCVTWFIYYGIGTWGSNKTVGWAWDITNFVWWIGIGHAGTLSHFIIISSKVAYWRKSCS
jgi:hypothetical protein